MKKSLERKIEIVSRTVLLPLLYLSAVNLAINFGTDIVFEINSLSGLAAEGLAGVGYMSAFKEFYH